jgi:hypothetical protein
MNEEKEQRPLKEIQLWFIASVVTTLLYIFLGIWVGDSLFSPDSWAYYELAQTLFTDEPYRFVTWRSYFSSEYSASFPFGYPMFVALLRFMSSSHHIAVWGNIMLVPMTLCMLFFISKRIQISGRGSLCIALCLVMYPGYVMEVLSGRSIPLALLLFFIAFWGVLRKGYLFAGLALGVATLVRFDMLVSSLLLGFGMLLLMKQRWKIMFVVLGFAIGVFPWVAYSQHHFGVNWVSDNSWVALSAKPAFVLDYPAEPILHAKEAPVQWLMRVVGNIPKLFVRLAISSIKFCVVPLIVVFAIRAGIWDLKRRKKSVLFFLLICLSLAPYVLTGYFDDRYFALFFTFLGGTLLYATKIRFVGIRGLMIAVLVVGIWGVGQALRIAHKKYPKQELMLKELQSLAECHRKERDKVYIFFTPSKKLASQYGAIYKMRAAIAPSNFESMDAVEQEDFLTYMKAYRIISKLPEDNPCQMNKMP